MTIEEAVNKLIEGIKNAWLRIKGFLKDLYKLYKERERKQSVRYVPVKHLPMKSQVNLRKPKFIQARSRL